MAGTPQQLSPINYLAWDSDTLIRIILSVTESKRIVCNLPRHVATCKPGMPGLTSFSETLILFFVQFLSFRKMKVQDRQNCPSKSFRAYQKKLAGYTPVNSICKSSWHAIRNIGKIWRHLDQESCARLVHAFVTFKLDSCNGVLTGLPDKEINKLQHVQNAAARLVAGAKKQEHITPV